MPIKLPTVQTGYERSVTEAAKKVGKNLRINMGPGAKSIESLSRPLGRLTGKADEFTKSMEAANARVLAFGASVGVIAAVSKGLQELVRSTVEVEKSLANINSILKQSESQLNSFKNQIFDIARNTGQTFETVSEAALELSRQGLKAEEVTKRLNDALVLSRLSGLSAADSVAGLTAAINSFSSAGITSAEVLNKISAAAASAAVSDRDLIEGLKRSGAVAVATGVKFDELVGIISALQEKTARGGAVIGNSLKTIFVRIQDLDRLQSIQRLGVEVTDLEGRVLSSNKIIENLAPTFAKLDQASRVNLADNLVGKFQIAPFLALLEDYNQKISRSGEVANTSLNATSEAYDRNAALSKTLAAAVNTATVNLKELANTLGEIGVTENLSKIIGVFNSIVGTIQNVLDGDGIGSTFAKGLIKGISTIIAGPGLALALVAIGKLLLDFAKFGAGALKTFFGLNRAAEAQAALQGQIAASLLNDKSVRSAILSIEKQNISEGEKKKLQTLFFTRALNEQLMLMQKMQGIAMTVAPGVMRSVPSFMTSKKPFSGKKASEGFLPIGAESSDISRGVGGAPASAKPVVIPNFAFGGGKRGTMVANDSEYIVPNYANGGDAVFNQNMVSSIGLPSNARKVRAASGYVPNFAATSLKDMLRRPGNFIRPDGSFTSNSAKAAYEKSTGEDRKLLDAQRNRNKNLYSYFANSGKNKTIMLLPQPLDFKGDGADHRFQVPHKGIQKNAVTFFEGGSSGIDKKLKNDKSSKGKQFKKLLTLDTDIDNAIATGVNTVFKDFKDASGNKDVFKLTPTKVTGKNVKDLMEKGGPGALGAIKGATFEALMVAITGGISQKGGELDIDFNRDKENILDLIFGIQGYRFGDFKSSEAQKDKFARQTLDNVKGVVQLSKKVKTKNDKGRTPPNAASGYIPNYVDPLQDAIGREKSAGLPVSQIRINQSGKLRSSQNPMGLAVTNTRDEPTGAIPNFAKGGVSSGDELGGSMDKLNARMMGMTSILYLLQSGMGAVVEESSGLGKAFSQLIQGVLAASMVMTTLQSFGGAKAIAGSISGLGAKGSNLMRRGSGKMAAGSTLMKSSIRANDAGLLGRGALTGLKGGLLKAGGALLRFAGPVGIAATAATLLYKGFTFGLDKFTGATEGLKNSQNMLAEAAKRAAKELSEIKFTSEEKKAEFLAVNVGLSNELAEKLEEVGFTGPSSKEAPRARALADIANKAYDAGATEKEILGILDMAKKEAGTETIATRAGVFLKQNEIDKDVEANIAARLKTLTLKDTSKRQEEFAETITPAQRKTLAVGGKNAERLTKELMEKAAKSGDIASQIIAESIGLAARQGEETIKKVDRINLENAKARLQTAIEVRKENFKLLTDTDKRIMKAEALGGLDDNSLLALKQKAKQQELLNNLASKNLDFINSQGDELTRLKLEDQQISDIENEILNISAEDLANKEKVLDIVDKIYQTNGLDKEVAGKLMESLGIQLEQNEGIFDASKNTLKNRQDETKELTKQKQLIKEIEAQRSLTAQTILFGKKNASGENRSGIQDSLRSLGVQKEKATRLGDDKQARDLTARMARLNQDLARISGDEGQASIDRRARNIKIPEAVENKFPKLKEKLRDPSSDPLAVLTKTGNDQSFKDMEFLARQRTDKALGLRPATARPLPPVSENESQFLDFKATINDLNQAVTDNTRTEQDSINASKDLTLSLSDEVDINKQLSKILAPFSRSESGNARRVAQANKNVLDGKAKNVDREFRRLTMEMGVFDRIGEAIPTALENSNQLNESLKDASLSFAHNIGNAMLDAIEKGENLGDILLGVASEFLSTMSRAFMKSAVDDVLGSFGIGKQGGGPIRGGSGTKDDVPAMLMGGEFVMNKKAVRKYGVGFMSSLNSGSMQGFRSGGQVRDREGMFTTPGMNGAGAIVGAGNLLSFATQTPIAMGRDTLTSNGAFLDPESGRLTMFGRRNNPQFQQVQGAKQQAFDLYASQVAAEEQAIRQKKESRKQLMKSLAAAAASVVVGAGVKSMAAGFKAGFTGTDGSFGTKFGAGVKGSLFGGNNIAGQSYGGLSNLFTGRGFQSGPSGIGSEFTPKSASARPTIIRSGGMPHDVSGLNAQDLYETDVSKTGVLPKNATGGLIPAAGGVDTVPAMLSGGEFVMNAAATRNIGAGNLQALNSGAGTGDNTNLVAKLDELIIATETSQSTGDINITINGSNGAETETQGQNSTDQQKALSDKIKTAVKQVIADEKRLGGQLRR